MLSELTHNRTIVPNVNIRNATAALSRPEKSIHAWLSGLVAQSKSLRQTNYGHLSIRGLAHLIENDLMSKLHITAMMEQQPEAIKQHISDSADLLSVVDVALTRIHEPNPNAPAGCPVSLLLDIALNTDAGRVALSNGRLSDCFHAIRAEATRKFKKGS